MVLILPGISSVATGNSDSSKSIFWRLSLHIPFDRYLPGRNTSGVKFSDRKVTLKQKNRDARTRILPFVTQYHPALSAISAGVKTITRKDYFQEFSTGVRAREA